MPVGRLSVGQTYDPLDGDFMPRVKRALEQLRLPSQSYAYAVHRSVEPAVQLTALSLGEPRWGCPGVSSDPQGSHVLLSCLVAG